MRIVSEPVGIPEDQYRAIHILLELPGRNRVWLIPIFEIPRVLKGQADNTSILQEKCAGRGDKSAAGTQLIFVLGQQEISFWSFAGCPQDAWDFHCQHQAVIHQGKDPVHIVQSRSRTSGES